MDLRPFVKTSVNTIRLSIPLKIYITVPDDLANRNIELRWKKYTQHPEPSILFFVSNFVNSEVAN